MVWIILDTAVLVAGTRSRRGASYALLRLIAEQRVILLATPALFLEWEDALKRPEHLAAAGLSVSDIDDALDDLAALIEPVAVHMHWRPQLSDPNDEFVLEAAINGRANAITTFNLRHLTPGARRFGIAVLTPDELVRRIRS